MCLVDLFCQHFIFKTVLEIGFFLRKFIKRYQFIKLFCQLLQLVSQANVHTAVCTENTCDRSSLYIVEFELYSDGRGEPLKGEQYSQNFF